MNKILLLIPTYNCEIQITRVLDSLIENVINKFHEILIVDNLSSDDTRAIVKKHRLYLDKKVKLFIPEKNRSLGGTHKLGFDYAIKNCFSHIAIFHGDDQGNINDLVEMIKDLDLGKSILGSRFSLKSKRINYSRSRILGNLILNILFSIKFRKFLKDLGSGVNVYSCNTLDRIDYYSFQDNLTFNYELISALASRKFYFTFHPIEWKETDQKSNAKNFKIFLQGIKIFLKKSKDKKTIGFYKYSMFEE